MPTRSGSILLIVIVLLVVLVGIGAVAWFYFSRDQEATAENILLTPVFRGPYEHIVLEQGQVESSSNVEIRCEVKSRSGGGTEIISVVDEGTNVKKGDKLVELDKSALDQDLVQQQIVCNTSHALVVQAENTLQAAEISRIEYLEGTFRQEEQTILSEIFVAEENLRRAQLSFQSTERLAAKGIVTALQLEGDQFAVDKAKNELEVGQTKLEVLRKYTREKTVKQFDSDIATAKARWEAEKKSDQLEDQKLKEIEEQIEKCTIFAPEDGQVVYASDHNRWGGSEFVV
ncbi:MAG: efflux transporter periplasmic adaptor subunit, partial [Planctomycetes bacterium]|nr:efflux transporter periplasmic adaptor subunit [Planctomycetota bacterium]